MKINSLNSISFKSQNIPQKQNLDIVKKQINGYRNEFYTSDGSFVESVEFMHKNDGKYLVLNKDEQGKNSYSMSIPDSLFDMSLFHGAVRPNRFCILSVKKDDKEVTRVLIASNGVNALYPEHYAENGCESLFLSKDDFKEFRRLAEEVLFLPRVPYVCFDTARIALNNYVYYSQFKDM